MKKIATSTTSKVSRNLVIPIVAVAALVGFLQLNSVRFNNLVKDSLTSTNRRGTSEGQGKEEYEFIHDDPKHYWHWTRENPPCPTLSKKNDCNNQNYKEMYQHFHEHGWVTFTSCSLKKNSKNVIDPIIDYLNSKQYGDKRRVNTIDMKEVKDLALDPDTLEFLAYIHGGRKPMPTQTLNFKIGTEQALHSDVIFFDSEPRSLMAAAWVAMEDMSDDNGPLRFIPKSHKWGVWDYEAIGLHWDHTNLKNDIKQSEEDIEKELILYGKGLQRALDRVGLKESYANDIKKGQTFIWAAGLIHGGSKAKDKSLTRMSQVTHYFFEGSKYYWQPRLSRPHENKIEFQYKYMRPCTYQTMDLPEEYPCVDKARDMFRTFKNDEM